MKGYRKSRIRKTVGDLPKIRRMKPIEVVVVETDLRIDSIADHARQQFFPEQMERHMNLNFLQNLFIFCQNLFKN